MRNMAYNVPVMDYKSRSSQKSSPWKGSSRSSATQEAFPWKIMSWGLGSMRSYMYEPMYRLVLFLLKPVFLIARGPKSVYLRLTNREPDRDVESQLHGQTGKLESQIRALEEKLRSCKIAQENHNSDRLALQSQISDQKATIDVLEKLQDRHEAELAGWKAETAKHQVELDNLRRNYKELLAKEREAKEEVYNRLSKVLSSQLTDNNPNIADLSDMNRPTKLAEQFSELYDNEWTNAFGVLMKIRDDDFTVITKLLTILMDCYNECRQHAEKQLENAKCKISDQSGDVSAAANKSLKDERKKTVHLTLPFIHELVGRFLDTRHGQDLLKDKMLEVYVRRCTELCWLMVVQDPPMAIVIDVPQDLSYNKAYYKQYTKSGQLVNYVVWPAILNQDGGALMGKGVAQCCDVSEESKVIDQQAAMFE